MSTTTTEHLPSRLKRAPVLGAVIAAIALLASVIIPTAAQAAPPVAGTYEGTSTAYNGATISFDIDSDGVMSNVESTSYCFDGVFTQPVIWAGGPTTPIEAGQPFDLEWQIVDDGFGTYYELQGVVDADGTASGTGRAGYLPSGTCGGMEFEWTAQRTDGGGDPGPDPQDPTVILEKEAYYDHEIQRVGIMIRGEGFPADTDVEVAIHRVSNGEERYSTVVRSDANGVVYDRYIGWLDHQPTPVNHRLTLTAEADGEEFTDEATFRAIPGGDGTFQYFHAREMTVTPQSIGQSELATQGVRIESGDMDGREDTAELIIDGEVVGEVPVVEIADEFGEVVHDYVDDSLSVGVHEAALRTVHVSGMNPVTWERVAWETFTVTEDPVEYEPTAEVNRDSVTESELAAEGVVISGQGFPISTDVELRINGDLVDTKTSLYNGQVVFEYTSSSLGVGTHDVRLWDGEYSADTSFTVTADPVEYDPTATASPTELTESELADTGVVASGEGFAPESEVTFSVNGDDVDTGTADTDGEVSFGYTSDSLGVGSHQIELSSADGSDTASFTVTEDPTDPEPVEVTAEAPTRDGNTVTIPVVEGVAYVDGSGTELSGTVTLEEGQSLTVTATADEGYVLADGTHEWVFEYEGSTDPDPETIPGVTPSEDDLDPALEGTITAPDEAEAGDTITIAVDGAAPGNEIGLWLFSDPTYLGAQTVSNDGTVTVTIPADTTPGEHTIAAWAGDTEAQLGWDTITIVTTDDDGDGDTGDGGDNGPGDNGPGTGGGGSDGGTGSDTTGDGAGDDQLAATGAPLMILPIAIAVLLLALGAGLVLRTNRRGTTG